MEGVVGTGEVRKKLLLLNIAAQGGNFLVITPDFEKNLESQPVNSRISVTGVLAANFNDQHQCVAFRVDIEIARALETGPRQSPDFIARFGGEEFTVILLSGEKDAQTAAESRRRRVADLAVLNPASPFRVVTISIGISTLKPGSKASPTDLISAADCSLYEAKRTGRNRVAPVCEPVCEPVVERELTEHRG